MKIRVLTRIFLANAENGINVTKLKLELTKGDSLEGSDDTPMYNPHILPLNRVLHFIILR